MEQEEVKTTEVPVEEQAKAEAPKSDNKVYKILSYIGILWLVGMFVKEKNDKSVRFHVGQGIILTIAGVIVSIAASIINNLIIANIFTTTVNVFGMPVTTVSGFGVTIMNILNLAVYVFNILFMVLGIINAAKGKDEELPYIGKFAFYK